MANKKRNIENSSPVKHYLDLLYMTPSMVSARDIVKLLQDMDCNDISIELWDEMNVLELELSNKNTIDFEPVEIKFKDPSDAAFVKNRNINTVFAVDLLEDDLEIVKKLFDKIISQYSGFLCADSEDFNPVYAGSSAIH